MACWVKSCDTVTRQVLAVAPTLLCSPPPHLSSTTRQDSTGKAQDGQNTTRRDRDTTRHHEDTNDTTRTRTTPRGGPKRDTKRGGAKGRAYKVRPSFFCFLYILIHFHVLGKPHHHPLPTALFEHENAPGWARFCVRRLSHPTFPPNTLNTPVWVCSMCSAPLPPIHSRPSPTPPVPLPPYVPPRCVRRPLRHSPPAGHLKHTP